MTIDDAVAVLNLTRHRGRRDWIFDPAALRIMPERWTERDTLPSLTAFEAVAIARGLVAIGAGRAKPPALPRRRQLAHAET
jgi:hypothetical protein